MWATKGVTLKAGEGAALAAQFKNPATVFASGVTIGGVKYMGIKGDEKYVPLSLFLSVQYLFHY